jgi:putative flippase GtrA
LQYRHFLHDDGRAAEILRFLLVGGGCFVFDYGLMVFLTEAAGLYYLWSSGISFTLSVVLNYWLCVKFVFAQAQHQSPKQMSMFIGSSVTGLLLTQFFMYVQVDWLGLNYMLAKFVAAGLVTIWNYIWKRKAVRGSVTGQGREEV